MHTHLDPDFDRNRYKISKPTLLYYWILTYIRELKKLFKRFTKKGRAELAYEKMRFQKIHQKIINHSSQQLAQNPRSAQRHVPRL